MPPHYLPWWSQILLLVWVGTAHAGGALFDSDEVLEVSLQGPLEETIEDQDERKERLFKLVLDGQELPVSVRVRGNSRARVCQFPPLRLKFGAEVVAGSVFEGRDKLKLVTHCKASDKYEQNVLAEYAAYRIFAMLSDTAYRTRLLRISYTDTAKMETEPLIRYGFLLESDTELAKRTQAEVVAAPHVVKSLMQPDQAALVFVFHYLIANTDWSLVTANGEEDCCHNGTLLAKDGVHYLVPYDFDLAGLVNARYARPDPSVGINNVRVRRYRGYCIPDLQIAAAVQAILDREVEITALVRDLPDTSSKETKRRLEFLARFFKAARDDEKFVAKLERKCIG
ncbi:MAG: hypothetical protein OEU60_11780 [Gammaproteobacteria bacterium]|nr:hypothetical protein [Gammaproteobacteria bacterium]